MRNVTAIAQLNVDVLYSGFEGFPRLGEEKFSERFSIALGGGAQATLLTLDALGVPTKLGTFYTEDIQSWLALKLLEEYGYDHYHNLYRGTGSPTVVTSVFSFPEDRAFLAYNEQADESALSDEELFQFLRGSKVCFAPQRPEVLRRLKDEGTTLVFDTGWHDDLSMEKYMHTLKLTDVFTPNDKEALKMTGAEDLRGALEILGQVVKWPIIKTGKAGCVTQVGGEVIEVPAVDSFEPVDTTGAGDNFLAGVIFGLYNDWDIVSCVRMGNVVGGYSTTGLGCLEAKITLEKALAIYSDWYGVQVRV